MAYGLEIVTSRLFVTDMRVDGRITCCPCQVFAFSEWDVLPIRVFVTLCKTKVNDIDYVLGRFVIANEEVVWLDVSVNNSLIVDFLYALNHLNSNVQACL